jgi:hypothetical protein
MPTNNPNRIQQVQQVQQPIMLQMMPTVSVQPIATPKKMVVKALDWSNDITAMGRSENVGETAKILFKDIRTNLSHLRQLHDALMNATDADLAYQKEKKGKKEDYNKMLESVNDLSRGEINQATITELEIILDVIALDRATIDTIFPQIMYTAMYMNELMAVRVAQIGYEDLRAEAEVALNQISTSEKKMTLENEEENAETVKTSIASVVNIINIFNEMQQSQNRILVLKQQDVERAKKTRNSVLIGMGAVILLFVVVIFALYWQDVQWKKIKDYPILGIPLAVFIWSFIGSFAAMLTQFNKEPIYKFGDTLKWVIIRPILGVVMGAAIYLALFSLVLTGKSQNDLLPLLVAFFVGYSDTFTFDIMASIQNVISNLFNSAKNEDIKNDVQPIYMVAPPTQPTPVLVTEPDNNDAVVVVSNHDDHKTTNDAVEKEDMLAKIKAEEAKKEAEKKAKEDKNKGMEE